MEIIRIDNSNIIDIQSMWESLNTHHVNVSTHFRDHFRNFSFEKRLAQFEDRDFLAVFVAKNKNDMGGYCIASVKNNSGEIDSIFVYPKFRNLGLV